jgi:hypothetical protein
MRITSDDAFQRAIHPQSRDECCSNARAGAEFAPHEGEFRSNFVGTTGGNLSLEAVDRFQSARKMQYNKRAA